MNKTLLFDSEKDAELARRELNDHNFFPKRVESKLIFEGADQTDIEYMQELVGGTIE